MATRDRCLSSIKDKVKVNKYVNGQYSNLNLNKNHQCLSEDFVQSKNHFNKNHQSYDFKNDSKGKKEFSSLWNKTTKNSDTFNLAIHDSDKKKKLKDQTKNSKCTVNNSTLSLHIAAYENSIIDSEISDGSTFDIEKSNCSKKFQNKTSFLTSSIIQNPFEFPRQQENGGGEPEVAQFKAAQKLLNPKDGNKKMNTSQRARKVAGGGSLERSGKRTDKLNRRKAEERIKGELDSFIRRLMGAKLIDEKTKTLTDKTNAIPELDVKLDEKELKEICLRVREQFMLEPVLLKLSPPICVLGDLHGQFLDLQKMMEKLGTPPKQKYLFLGDYVDRGAFSLETVTMLLAMKVRYPKHIYLLRGNHETRAVNKIYGFFDECKRRFPEDKKNELWTLYQHVFNCMPMSAVIGEKIFCTHGGISEDLLNWKQFDRIIRPTDVTDLGLLTDLVWADPSNETKRYEISPRGISMVFGPTAIEEFCSNLGIELIVRGHQAVQEGYEFSSDKKCLTIFSAPAYCGEQDNLAGILTVSRNLECTIYTFKGVGKNPGTLTQCGVGGGGGLEKEKEMAAVSPSTAVAPPLPAGPALTPTAQSPSATTARNNNNNNNDAKNAADKGPAASSGAAKETSLKERKESSVKEKAKK